MRIYNKCTCIVLVFSVLCYVTAVEQKCTAGWTYKNLRCYRAKQIRMTQELARLNCTKSGADLVSIHSKAQRQDVLDFLIRSAKYKQPTRGRRWINIWTGAYASRGLGKSATWRWSDGSAWDYNAWLPGEPNGAQNAKCANLWLYGGDKMNDANCRTPGHVLCYKSPRNDNHGMAVTVARSHTNSQRSTHVQGQHKLSSSEGSKRSREKVDHITVTRATKRIVKDTRKSAKRSTSYIKQIGHGKSNNLTRSHADNDKQSSQKADAIISLTQNTSNDGTESTKARSDVKHGNHLNTIDGNSKLSEKEDKQYDEKIAASIFDGLTSELSKSTSSVTTINYFFGLGRLILLSFALSMYQ